MQALVLDGNSDAGLEVVQALGRAGVEVDVSSENAACLAFHSRYVARRLIEESPVDSLRFTRWVRAEDAKRGYCLIVPSTESALVGLSSLEDDDPLRAKAVLPLRRSLDIALDKQQTWDLAHRLGVSVPRSILIERLDHASPVPAYPILLKPIHSKVAMAGRLASLHAQVVRDDAQRLELLRAWLRHTPVQQQDYVPGRGVGVEFLYDRGRKVWHFAHERLHELPLTGGGSSYRRSIVPGPELLRSAESVLEALQWHGVAMVEYKVGPDGQFCLLEINPRLWGSLALAIDAGANFPLGLLALAQGGPPPPQPAFRAGFHTRNIPRDVQWFAANLRADTSDPLLFTRPRAASFVELLRPLTGNESWDHFDRGDLGVTARMLRRLARDVLRKGFHLVRDGRIKRRLRETHERIRRALASRERPVRTLLFLCHGNICRSPFAAVLARSRFPNITCESAGFHPQTGRESPPDFASVAASVGVDLRHERSRRADRELIATADLILAMDLANYRRLCREFPEAREKSTLLGLFAAERQFVIEDPYDASEPEVRRSLSKIEASIAGLADVLQPATESHAGQGAWEATPAATGNREAIDSTVR